MSAERVDFLRQRLYEERAALPHCVYRAFDAAGQLLYVGCTFDFERRRTQHARKPWSTDVHHWSVRWYANRSAALVEERRSIDVENPAFNVSVEEAARRAALTVRRRNEVERAERMDHLREVMSSLRPRCTPIESAAS